MSKPTMYFNLSVIDKNYIIMVYTICFAIVLINYVAPENKKILMLAEVS